MKSKLEFSFEQLDSFHSRAKVPGWWLVKALEDVVHETDRGKIPGWGFRVAMAFVPDPEHKWVVGGVE